MVLGVRRGYGYNSVPGESKHLESLTKGRELIKKLTIFVVVVLAALLLVLGVSPAMALHDNCPPNFFPTHTNFPGTPPDFDGDGDICQFAILIPAAPIIVIDDIG